MQFQRQISDMLKNYLSDNKDIGDVKKHRNKYNKVLCLNFEDLERDIGGNKYYLLLYESNDISI